MKTKNRMLIQSFMMMVMTMMWLFTLGHLSHAAEFSAEFAVKMEGENELVGKIFVKGNKVRQEMTEEGETQVIVVRPDKNATWMLTPSEKSYIEMPYQSDSAFEEWSAEKQSKAKLLGEETVSGLSCKKYEIVEDDEAVTFWVSNKFSFPVKVKDSESVMEYRNIKEGSVPDSMFEIPAEYKKMSMPMMPGAPQ